MQLNRLPRMLALSMAAALAPVTMPALQAQAQAADSALIAGLEWRNIGPTNMSGRVTDVEGVPGTATVYVASAAGGIWKTINNGTTFHPIFDDQRVIAMGDLAIAPSDPNVLYAGTGEEDSRNSISPGAGVYVSRDGGESWTFAGLEETQAIGRILVHPTDPNTAWVAALGHIWGPNDERGLYRTRDGGESWDRVKHISDRAGFVDLAMDPRDPDVLWASSWERVRGPWFLESGGPGSGLWKSTDGGDSWTEVSGGGFPETEKGRIGIAIAPSDPDVMYALVEARAGETAGLSDEEAVASGQKGSGLYRSDDAGRTWRLMNDENTRPFYYSQVRVAPDDADLVFWSSTPVRFSRDGGKTAGQATLGIHVDHHAMWWDPSNPDHFVVGNDGGIGVTWDRGGTYDFINTLPIGQFYHVSYNMAVPYRVCGGLQDNGTWCGPSRRVRGGIDHHMWYTISGGDGFYSQQDPTDPDIVYAESQGGNMSRVNLTTGERSRLGRPEWQEAARPLLDSIAVYEGIEEPRELSDEERAKVDAWKATVAADSARLDLRYNWSTPVLMSPHAPQTIYAAGNRVLKSTDRGDTFEVISPDLTTADTMKIRVSTETTGGITRDVTGAETHSTIVVLAESPLVKGLLFAGTDDGNVWMSRNDGEDWEQIEHRRFDGLPRNTWVSRIEPSHHDADRFYVSFDGHRADDFTPYVYLTENGGRRFRSIAKGLPTGAPDFVHVIREDAVNPDLLFVGTDLGVQVSTDRGRSWRAFMEGLPTVPVHDLEIHPRESELIAATHGRSIWIVDIAPLQQLTAVREARSPVVFAPRPGLQYGDPPSGGESTGHRYFDGESPDFGAAVTYWIPQGWKAPPAEDAGEKDEREGDAEGGGPPGRRGPRGPQLQLAVLNVAGDTMASLNGPARPGLHRVYWNLREQEEEAEPKSPSELRDSVVAAREMLAVADSLVEHEGVDRRVADRAVEMLRSGDRSAMWGGRGGGAGDPARPGESYPPEIRAAAPRLEPELKAAPLGEPVPEAAAGVEAEAEAAQPSSEEIGEVVRQIYYALRDRDIRMSFRGWGGGGPSWVEPGAYTVSVKVGDEEITHDLTVVRADGFVPEESERSSLTFREWWKER